MIDKRKSLFTRAAPGLVGIGLAAIAVGAGQAGSAHAPVRCEIQASMAGGMVALEGIVRSDVAVSGSYSFHVTSSGPSGNSNIRQGGGFTAAPGDEVRLGRMTLGGNARYEATLEIAAGGGASAQCAGKAGGAI